MKITKKSVLISLIILGILAILSSLYVQYAKPYLAEKKLEKMDAVRIHNLDTLDSLIKSAVSASSTSYIGASSTIYISIPSDDQTCSNLDLPFVPDGWSYHCVSTSTLRNTDGTGWLPINLSTEFTQLPVDPVNNTRELNYFRYIASSTDEYSLSCALESKKMLALKALRDTGVDNTLYELGSNLKLEATAQGLIGYYLLNETKTDLMDLSGNNNDGFMSNPILKKEGCILENCLQLKNTGQVITFKKNTLSSKKITIMIWVNLEKVDRDAYELIWNPSGAFSLYAYNSRQKLSSLSAATINGNQRLTDLDTLTYNEWHQLGFVFSEGLLANITDGNKHQEIDLGTDSLQINNNMLIINNRDLYKGYLNEFRIYNRDLSPIEIKKSYTALQK
jgi:hypothetical protein